MPLPHEIIRDVDDPPVEADGGPGQGNPLARPPLLPRAPTWRTNTYENLPPLIAPKPPARPPSPPLGQRRGRNQSFRARRYGAVVAPPATNCSQPSLTAPTAPPGACTPKPPDSPLAGRQVATPVSPSDGCQAVLPDTYLAASPDTSQASPPDDYETAPPDISQAAPPDIPKAIPPDISQAVPPDISQAASPDNYQAAQPDTSPTTPPDNYQAAPPDISPTAPPYTSPTTPPDNCQAAPPNTDQTAPTKADQAAPPTAYRAGPPDTNQAAPSSARTDRHLPTPTVAPSSGGAKRRVRHPTVRDVFLAQQAAALEAQKDELLLQADLQGLPLSLLPPKTIQEVPASKPQPEHWTTRHLKEQREIEAAYRADPRNEGFSYLNPLPTGGPTTWGKGAQAHNNDQALSSDDDAEEHQSFVFPPPQPKPSPANGPSTIHVPKRLLKRGTDAKGAQALKNDQALSPDDDAQEHQSFVFPPPQPKPSPTNVASTIHIPKRLLKRGPTAKDSQACNNDQALSPDDDAQEHQSCVFPPPQPKPSPAKVTSTVHIPKHLLKRGTKAKTVKTASSEVHAAPEIVTCTELPSGPPIPTYTRVPLEAARVLGPTQASQDRLEAKSDCRQTVKGTVCYDENLRSARILPSVGTVSIRPVGFKSGQNKMPPNFKPEERKGLTGLGGQFSRPKTVRRPVDDDDGTAARPPTRPRPDAVSGRSNLEVPGRPDMEYQLPAAQSVISWIGDIDASRKPPSSPRFESYADHIDPNKLWADTDEKKEWLRNDFYPQVKRMLKNRPSMVTKDNLAATKEWYKKYRDQMRFGRFN